MQFAQPGKWESYTKIPISHRSVQTSFLIQHIPCDLFPYLKFIAINTEHEKCETMPVQPSLWPCSFATFIHFSGLFKCQRSRQTRITCSALLFKKKQKQKRPPECYMQMKTEGPRGKGQECSVWRWAWQVWDIPSRKMTMKSSFHASDLGNLVHFPTPYPFFQSSSNNGQI